MTEETGMLQFKGSQSVRHDLVTEQPQKPSYPSKIRDIPDIGLFLYLWENFRQRI